MLPIVLDSRSTGMYVPDGYGTMFPYICVADAPAYLQFLQQAFGARELGRTVMPDGEIANARVRIGDTSFMVSDHDGLLLAFDLECEILIERRICPYIQLCTWNKPQAFQITQEIRLIIIDA